MNFSFFRKFLNKFIMSRQLVVYLVRHGETAMNAKRQMQGHTDVPLNEIGEKQAKLLGQYFSKQNQKFSKAYSSDLLRAHKTAQLILQELGKSSLEIETDKILRERCFGEVEGLEVTKVIEMAANGGFQLHEYVPKGAELPEDVLKRTSEFFQKLCKQAEEVKDEENILVVSHGGWILNLMRYINNREDLFLLENFDDIEAKKCPANTGISIFKIYPATNGKKERLISFSKMNDSSHLKNNV